MHKNQVAPLVAVNSSPDEMGDLRGRATSMPLPSGLSIHASDTHSFNNTSIDFIAPEGVTLGIFLESKPNWMTSNRTMLVGQSTTPCGIVWSRPNPIAVKRCSEANIRTRHVNVIFSWDWLRLRLGNDWPKTLPEFQIWQPSAALLAQADLIICSREENKESRLLTEECFALSLLADYVDQGQHENTQCVSSRHWQQLQPVVQTVKQNLRKDFELATLAASHAMSRSTLQRLFNEVYGVSAVAFIRREKLAFAQQMLGKKAMTVAQAAYAVGYNNPANFATAFRKHFGYSPRQAITGARIRSQ